MTDHEVHALADERVGHRAALLGIARVVADHEIDLLAVEPARRVEVVDRLLHALLELRAEHRVLPGQRTGDADLELLLTAAGRERQGGEDRGGECSRELHEAHEVISF